MSMKLSQWRDLLLLLACSFLFACDQARDAERLIAAGEESEKAGQLQVAADLYHRAAGLRPQDFDTQYRAALLDLRDGHFTAAEAHLRKTIALRPDFAPAHLNLGVALLQNGKKAEGRQELLEALRLDPRFTKAYYNSTQSTLERCLVQSGRCLCACGR